MRRARGTRWGLALFLLVAACASGESADSTVPISLATSCAAVEGEQVPWDDGPTATLDVVASVGHLDVYAVEYPRPGPTTGLWSQWGQGVIGPDGHHYSAVGDHLGVDGNSYLFVYDPSRRTVTRFADALTVIERESGTWGFGKIHAPMVVDECGGVWAATYWGTRTGIRDYDGDHLIRIDPQERTVADAGVVVEAHGVPSMTIAAGSQIVVEAVDPWTDTGVLAHWDVLSSRVASGHEDPDQTGFRALAVDSEGRVLFSTGGGRLMAWDSTSGTAEQVTDDLPGEWMRAATPVDGSGVIYGVTQDPPALFSLDADGRVELLGDPGGYTTSLGFDERGGRVFWMAGAHGDSWETGATVMTLDVDTGEMFEVVSLQPVFEGELGLRVGGTYSMVYSGGRLFIGVNASPIDDDSGFGRVVLVVVEGL